MFQPQKLKMFRNKKSLLFSKLSIGFPSTTLRNFVDFTFIQWYFRINSVGAWFFQLRWIAGLARIWTPKHRHLSPMSTNHFVAVCCRYQHIQNGRKNPTDSLKLYTVSIVYHEAISTVSIVLVAIRRNTWGCNTSVSVSVLHLFRQKHLRFVYSSHYKWVKMTMIWKSDTSMPQISKLYITKNDYYMKIGDIIETLMSTILI